MEDSAFSFLGDSMIETDSVPMMSDVMMGVTASSLPFTPRLGEFETDMAMSCDVALQTDPAYLEMQCSCSCHLFRNNPTPEDNICQVCCFDNSDLASSISEMLSQNRSSRHCSNGSSHRIITTPPNSVVSENPSDEVIILSTCGTPPYPTTITMPWTKNPEWIWDWSSRPEATPPKGWPCETSESNSSTTSSPLHKYNIPVIVLSHVLAVVLGIYIGRRFRTS